MSRKNKFLENSSAITGQYLKRKQVRQCPDVNMQKQRESLGKVFRLVQQR